MRIIKELSVCICIAVMIVLGIFGVFKIISKMTTHAASVKMASEVRDNTWKQCLRDHGREIMEYVKECTASLSVEENAYVVSECENVARRNLCPF